MPFPVDYDGLPRHLTFGPTILWLNSVAICNRPEDWLESADETNFNRLSEVGISMIALSFVESWERWHERLTPDLDR